MAKLILHNLIEKENSLYSAACFELDVASQGKPVHEAKKSLQEAIELYLEAVCSDSSCLKEKGESDGESEELYSWNAQEPHSAVRTFKGVF